MSGLFSSANFAEPATNDNRKVRRSDLHRFQPTHRSRTRSKSIDLDPEPLQHRDVKIRPQIIVLLIENKPLTALETASSEDRGQVPISGFGL
ncbi:MAG: hypothetical protein ACI8UO_004524 [Verrucomicrobiales bacterium]|jgi:hypothetical protein